LVLVGLHLHQPAAAFFGEHVGIGALVFFVASLAMGMVLEDVASALEHHVWDPLLEDQTGCHDRDWVRYLGMELDDQPVGQRYLRTVLLRMKFEASFGVALIVCWIGLLWWDSLTGFADTDAVVGFSAVLLSLSAYMIWESGRGARVLADLRHIIVAGERCSAVRRNEAPGSTKWVDRSLVVYGLACLLSGLVLFGLVVNQVAQVNRWAGLSSAVLGLTFGGSLVLVSREDHEGRRRQIAMRVALASALAATLLTIRLLDRGYHPIGLVATGFFVLAAVWFRVLSWAVRPRADAG
jgi:hypothetical protein